MQEDANLLYLLSNLCATLSMGYESKWPVSEDCDHPFEVALLLIKKIGIHMQEDDGLTFRKIQECTVIQVSRGIGTTWPTTALPMA
jgi:hypothetical protein